MDNKLGINAGKLMLMLKWDLIKELIDKNTTLYQINNRDFVICCQCKFKNVINVATYI